MYMAVHDFLSSLMEHSASNKVNSTPKFLGQVHIFF